MTIKSNKRTTKPPTKYQTYMLRTCNSDYTSHNGFKYPKNGFVYAKDWDDKPVCGNGLHGLLKGEGEPCYLGKDPTAIWQVLMVDSREVVGLDDKVKVPRAWVILSGNKDKAIAKTQELGCSLCVFGTVTAGYMGTATAGIGGTATAGYKGTANAGDWGTANAGDCGTATAGYKGTATAGKGGTATAGLRGTAKAGIEGTANAGFKGTANAGDWGTAKAGIEGTANAGFKGTATAGDWGTVTAGKCGTASAGNYGTAKAGIEGTANAGDYGTANAGDYGTATAGRNGTASAGEEGTIQIKYWDSMSYRMRIVTGYIGENGLLPDVKYKVDENGKFYEVK